jgi:F420-0:gamma-glutamyl ligase-like protein
MTRYKVLAINTKYWTPGKDYLEEIVKKVGQKLADGDIVVVSEKAISTASNNIVDESKVSPSIAARFIAKFWMRTIWGHLLGMLCHFRPKFLEQLRTYPSEAGARHKQVVLQNTGLLEALMFGSEGGIDGSNLPYSYVSLPLRNAPAIAEKIRRQIELKLAKKVVVVIADTDKTFAFRNFHFTHRPKPVKGIHSHGGFIAYVIGRRFNLKKRSTPLAVAGCKLPVEKALEVSEVANRSRGFGAGRTVWEMADRFKVPLTEVTWEMLDTVKHKPIVILRSNK